MRNRLTLRAIVMAGVAVGIAAAGAAARSEAQTTSGRTLQELKAEAVARADRNAYPLIGRAARRGAWLRQAPRAT